jgi:coenzyme F420-reducing hydrogenase delta subunit
VSAEKEYGVDQNFIVRGIRAGRLKYREGTIWGNPFVRLLRRQLEQYIAEERGADYLSNSKKATELRMIKKEIGQLKKRLKEIELRKTELENQS